MYQFRVRKSDQELIQKLDEIKNRSLYLKNLILEDLNPSVLTIKQIKEKIKTVIEKHNIKDVYLFGSYARGEATKDSDVDIYCDSGNISSLWDLSSFKEELIKALGKDVDIVTIGSQMDDFFKEQLDLDKIKLW
ncbi:MAG: nucleotidyltransferase domain-containing protein [Bacilli bacterium]|nr:nucleotidyltransferase domain-containing protein [Bacilli bacterium]